MELFRKEPNENQGRPYRYGCFRYTLIPIAVIILLIIMFATGCCMAQIPTQYYLLNDSCEFYLPDYSQAVQVKDNCCVDENAFLQEPHSGTLLSAGTDIIVTLTAFDCYGNTRTMSFDVVAIDMVPPEFDYDSAAFIPSGMYQNELRTWHFYTVIESTDSLGIAEMTHYYRNE